MVDNYKYSLPVLCHVKYLEKLLDCLEMLILQLKAQHKLDRILHSFLWVLGQFIEKGGSHNCKGTQ